MAEDDDGVRLGGLGLGDGFFQSLARIGGEDTAEDFGRDPVGEAGGDEANEGNLEAADIAHAPRKDFSEGAGEVAGQH